MKKLQIRQPLGSELRAMKSKLGKLTNMTPGDYAAVARKVGILANYDTAEAVYQALEHEAMTKPGAGQCPIGFVPD